MLNPGAWNWSNFAGFFWVCDDSSLMMVLRLTALQGGICFLCIIYTYFRVPEPSGRSFAELDLLFEQGVSARKFKKTQVNVFAENVDSDELENYEKQKANERTRTVFV